MSTFTLACARSSPTRTGPALTQQRARHGVDFEPQSVRTNAARTCAHPGDLAVTPSKMWLTGRSEGGKSWQVAMGYQGGDLWVVVVGSAGREQGEAEGKRESCGG
ncbi:hypothetical protein C8J57DRAFT_1261035 [Mycena rebaudengoi]|nr:hypothetical protein C8J57DRAFT_1261035 [Mycena rebaudengoi]